MKRIHDPTCDHIPMDVLKMLAELRAERERIEQAILVLERIAAGGPKRRGRPPKWMTAAAAPPNSRKTFTRSPAARARMAAAQRARWSKRKQAETTHT